MTNELTNIQSKFLELLPNPTNGVSLYTGFGAGAYGNVKSFGGNTIRENSARVDVALSKSSELQRIWNHPMSQWNWKHLNLSHLSEWRNIRQIAAELASKRDALNEAKWKYVENEIKIAEYEEQLEELTASNANKFEILRTQLEIAKLRENMANHITYVEGAMKDVLTLSEVYDSFVEKYKTFTEEDFEKAEAKSHLTRSLSQCLRDIREHGRITKGEQEYLEQIGLNPSKIHQSLLEYLQKFETAENANWDVEILHKYIDDFSDFLLPHTNKKMLIMGYPENVNTSITY